MLHLLDNLVSFHDMIHLDNAIMLHQEQIDGIHIHQDKWLDQFDMIHQHILVDQMYHMF
jgi:hypothetical protein